MSKLNYIFIFILISNLTIILSNNQTQQAPTVELPDQIQNQKENIKTPKSPMDEKKEKEIYNLIQDFNLDWENRMHDYVSDYDYNIPLRPRIQELYYENVTTIPSIFKGAYIISDETTDKIEFIVKDPYNQIIYQVTKHHDVFEIPINITGKYSIIFNNKISKSNLMITFTMNSGQNNMLNAKDLTKTEQKIEVLNNVIKKFNLEFKFGHDIHTRRYQSKFYLII